MSFEYIEIDDPVYSQTHETNAEDDYILVKPKICNLPVDNWQSTAYCFTKRFQLHENEMLNMEVKVDDVWVASYPKSGTTWCQEMVWLICNNLNFETARSLPLKNRFPFLDVSLIHDLPNGVNSFEKVQNFSSPRFIKTHLPASMLPPHYWKVLPKTVYINRNVKSIAVSYYHHSKNIFYRGTKEAFIQSFMKNLQFYSPVHNHVIEYHSLQGCNNILYLNYEDMKLNLRKTVLKACNFFGKVYSDVQVEQLCNHLSFSSMKNNISCNYEDVNDVDWKAKNPDQRFIRRGEIDSWKHEILPEQINALDEWTHKTVTNKDHLNLFL